MNLPARSYIPHLGQLMREAGATQVSANALSRLRTGANQTYPGDGTLRKLLYERGLVKHDMAVGILNVLNFHLLQKGLRTVNDNDAIADFEAYIEGFGRSLNFLESVPHPNKDPVGEIAAVATYTTDVVVSLKKKRLVPVSVANAVLNAMQTVASGYTIPVSIMRSLRVAVVPLNEQELQPIAGKGREDIITTLAKVKI